MMFAYLGNLGTKWKVMLWFKSLPSVEWVRYLLFISREFSESVPDVGACSLLRDCLLIFCLYFSHPQIVLSWIISKIIDLLSNPCWIRVWFGRTNLGILVLFLWLDEQMNELVSEVSNFCRPTRKDFFFYRFFH